MRTEESLDGKFVAGTAGGEFGSQKVDVARWTRPAGSQHEQVLERHDVPTHQLPEGLWFSHLDRELRTRGNGETTSHRSVGIDRHFESDGGLL